MLTVVKVGGSLYDWPELRPRLGEYLAGLGGAKIVVPGGGPFADAARRLDAAHRLGDPAAHRFALASLAAPAAFLRELLGPGVVVFDPALELEAIESKFGPVPQSWDVTTDSLAAYIAADRGARLVLLKSRGLTPGEASGSLGPAECRAAEAAGLVDAHFGGVVERLGLSAAWANLRAGRAGGVTAGPAG